MKINKVALAAILLWAATIAVMAWLFVKGNTVQGTDGRTAVVLTQAERGFVLAEMRGLLAGTHGIVEGITHGDMKRVAEASRAVGMAAAADANPALMAKLPLAFKQLGMRVHRDMDQLAAAADGGRPPAELLTMLSDTLSKCVACHATWQLTSASAK